MASEERRQARQQGETSRWHFTVRLARTKGTRRHVILRAHNGWQSESQLSDENALGELVADDERCHCGAGSGTRPDSDTGDVRSKHTRLVGAEGALTAYIH